MRALRIAELAMFDMRQEDSPPPDDLYSALRDIVYRPVTTLVPPWSWKAAALSALLRGITFFAANLRSGHQHALLRFSLRDSSVRSHSDYGLHSRFGRLLLLFVSDYPP